MRIKSRVWHWLAVACGGVGLVTLMGVEGETQVGGALNSTACTTAFILILLAALFMKLGFLAQEREEREAKRHRTAGSPDLRPEVPDPRNPEARF